MLKARNHLKKRGLAGRCRTRGLGALLVASMALVGCDSLLDVKVPGRVSSEALDNPALAPILVNGAVADFECAYAQYIGRTGLLTDEFITSAGWRAINIVGARLSDLGREGGGNCVTSLSSDNTQVYGPLHRARFQAEDAYRRVSDFPAAQVPNRERLLATAATYAGYAYALLGEGFCEGAVDAGPRVSREELWRQAETRFSTAMQHGASASAPEITNLARVGRARVRLNLGDLSGAASDAEAVPQGFVMNATYSTATARRYNRVHSLNRSNNFMSVHPSFRGLTVEGIPDPRVEVADGGRMGHDGVTRMFYAQKHASLSTPIPIGSWREAQLIIAEARGGQEAVQAINRLRESVELPAFNSSDGQEIYNQVVEERRRELFALGHRINDLLRLGLPWEEGATHKGEPFGDVTCMPLVDGETLNNPNFGS